jgi:hypothetical protein
MEGVNNLTSLTSGLIEIHKQFINSLPNDYIAVFINLMFLIVIVFLYSIFVWKLYRFIATKNFLGGFFDQYTEGKGAASTKFLYFIEYIILSPFLIFFWFSAFALFLIFLTENFSVPAILTVSTVVIAAVRMTAYYNEDLSRDLAKMLPFTLLAIAMITPNFFDMERVISQISQIPIFFNSFIAYLGFIFLLELTLRFFGFIFSLFGLDEE